MAALARRTSAASPLRFSTEIVVQAPGSEAPGVVLRSLGLVDWARGRGSRTDFHDASVYTGGPSQGLQSMSRVWLVGAQTVEQRSSGTAPSTPTPVRGTSASFVGLTAGTDGLAGPAGAAEALTATLAGQHFGAGVTDHVGSALVTRYTGTPVEGDGAPVELWVDAKGRISRLAIPTRTVGVPARAVITFFDFGTSAAIEAPPT